MQTEADLRAVLARYRHFEECLLTSMSSADHLTGVCMTFDYIWDDEDPGGATVAEPFRKVVLEFRMVRSLRFDNQIPPSVVAEPERASWGLTEVAAVRLEDPPEPGAPLHHVAISWEGATRIDVVFGSLIVSEH